MVDEITEYGMFRYPLKGVRRSKGDGPHKFFSQRNSLALKCACYFFNSKLALSLIEDEKIRFFFLTYPLKQLKRYLVCVFFLARYKDGGI